MRSRNTIATPPGVTIKEQLEDRGMTQKEFAQKMDMSQEHSSKLLNGEIHLTPDIALQLEHVLDIPAKFWNNLEARYLEKCARVQLENDRDSKNMDKDIDKDKDMDKGMDKNKDM